MTVKLLGISLASLFSDMFLRRRPTSKKRSLVVAALIALLAVYVVGTFLFMFGFVFHRICAPLFSAGYGWLYFALVGMTVFLACFFASVFAAQSQIFSARDNEMLLSLPVRPSAILFGRIGALLLLDYMFEALVAVPAGVVWGMSRAASAAGVAFFVISMLLLPLMAMSVACLLAWVIALISSRLRRKNAVTLVLSLVFLFAFFWVYANMPKYIQYLLVNGAQIAAAVERAAFPFYHMGVAAASGSAASMLIFAACAAAPFAAVVWLISVNFVRIATANRGRTRAAYTRKAIRASGVRASLLKKEAARFFSSPAYILNTALGGVFMVAFAVFLAVKRDMVMPYLAQLEMLVPGASAPALAAAALSAIAAMNFVSAPSVSLEGKSLWIAKSLPVESSDVLMAKAGLHVAVCGLPAAVSAAVIAAATGATALQTVMLLVAPISVTVFVAFLGVAVNLQFPRFDWVSEVQPIKQGASSILTMFGSLAAVVLLFGAYVPLRRAISAEVYILLCAAAFSAASAALAAYLKRGGSRRFEAL